MLTGFQLRAARGALNIFTKDLTQSIGLHNSTLVRLEECTPNLSYPKCNSRTLLLITNFFESEGILFPNKNAISLKKTSKSSLEEASDYRLTKFQLKSARIAMRLSQKLLGEYIGFPQSTLSELEGIGNNVDYIKCSEENAKTIKYFFLENGIIFPDFMTVELTDDPVSLLNQQKKLFDIGNK